MLLRGFTSIRALRGAWPSLEASTRSSYVRACSTGGAKSTDKMASKKAKARSDRLEEEVGGLQKVTQRAANILCGLSERTTTHKILYVGVEQGGDDGKTFSYFLGESSTFDISGVGEDSQDLAAIKQAHNYSEVYPFTRDGGMPSEYRRNGFQYVVAISPSPDSHIISPLTALEYTADGGYIIYGLPEQSWEGSAAMESLMSLGDADKAQLLAVQIIDGVMGAKYFLGLIRKA
jgi:hypothetical protein